MLLILCLLDLTMLVYSNKVVFNAMSEAHAFTSTCIYGLGLAVQLTQQRVYFIAIGEP